jgi:predicted nucleotidyltransferase component of viral defense system
MEILTEFQKEFILAFSKTPLIDSFFLTGGTALSAFYLQHRLSEDLDFFTEEEGQISRALPIIQNIAFELNSKIEIRRSFLSFIEFFLVRNDESIRFDFAMDSPYRLAQKVFREGYGIYIDNVTDISCNKLSALYDRSELKDFVDIYFIDKEIIPFEELVEKAKEKHIGLDDYWLAVSLSKIESLNILPRMIKSANINEIRDFFEKKLQWLMEKL